MKRNLKILILVVAVAALLLPFGHALVHAQTPAPAQATDNSWTSWLDPIKWATSLINLVGFFLLRIGALILSLVGLIFNEVLDYTIVHMADQVNDPKGLGGGIDTAWATLRDIANMVFIFVLLWAAIQTILQLNTSKFTSTIRNIIIIALLINFSLFFSKVVIDAANVATIGFYNSILAGAGQPITLAGFPIGDFAGIFMKATGVQSFYGSQLLTSLQQSSSADITQFLTGLLGMVTMLVMAMVLLVASVMFVARYILLVFIMILSPIAFVGYILPAMRSMWSKWLSALISQSFFAPVFMILIWVALRIISALSLNIQGHEFSTIATLPKDTVTLFLNFALVIGFIVAALIISKQMASKTMGFSAITAGAGAVVIGGVANAGRNTVGRLARARTKNKDLLDRAARGDTGARLQLAAATKLSKSSFDVRAAADSNLGKAIGAKAILDSKVLGKAGGKDGFSKSVDEKAKAAAKYAKDTFSSTNEEKAEADRRKKIYEESKKADEAAIPGRRREKLQQAQTNLTASDEARKKYIDDKLQPNRETIKNIKLEKEAKEKELAEEKKLRGDSTPQVLEKQKELEAIDVKMTAETENAKKLEEDIKKNDQQYLSLDNAFNEHKKKLTDAQKRINEKNKFYEDEYSPQVQVAQKRYDEYKDAGKNRQIAYADRIANGPRGGVVAAGATLGPLGAGVAYMNRERIGKFIGGLQGNQEAAAKIKSDAKGKSNKDKAADILKDIAKDELGVETEAEKPKEEAGGGEEKGGEEKKTE